MVDFLVQEDGFKILLEQGGGALLLEQQVTGAKRTIQVSAFLNSTTADANISGELE